MFRFTVYQLQIQQEVYDKVNEVGHEKAWEIYPVWKTRLDLMSFGSTKFKNEMWKDFAPVAELTANDLEHAFNIMNIGPREEIHALDNFHSMSVGDIVFDRETSTFYMVDIVGFNEIEPQKEVA